jgi:hypothetical protein
VLWDLRGFGMLRVFGMLLLRSRRVRELYWDGICLDWGEGRGWDGGFKGGYGVGLDWGSTGWVGLWSGSWSLIWTRKAFYEFMNMDLDILGRAQWNMNFFLQLFSACISFHSGTSLNLLKPTS